MITDDIKKEEIKVLLSQAERELFRAQCVAQAWEAAGNTQNATGSVQQVTGLMLFKSHLESQLKALD